MQKLIKNDWRPVPGRSCDRTEVLRHEIHPEGLDIARVRFRADGPFDWDPGTGHLLSVLRGGGTLRRSADPDVPLTLTAGSHLYLPAGLEGRVEARKGAEMIVVSGRDAAQAKGGKLILRHEKYIAACASETFSFRWIFTPQYLSRRVFLHHDPVLLSKSGHPVSWFHTTMFDVAGLPPNEDGESVFKMSYNSRTEINVCYDVRGACHVRMALHPYKDRGQAWGPWNDLDGESSYHLNEPAGGPEEEVRTDDKSGGRRTLRNKHEVRIIDGHVSLFCLFDPAPTGMERHRPGEYSDYEPLSRVLGTAEHRAYLLDMADMDDMVDRLSLADAAGRLEALRREPVWELYRHGRAAQRARETDLLRQMAAQKGGREKILAPWTLAAGGEE